MAEQKLVEAYRRGEIGAVTLVRKLLQLGLSASAALAMTLAISSPAHAGVAAGHGTAAIEVTNAANNPNLAPNTANFLNNVASALELNQPPGNNAPNGNPGALPLE